MARTPKRSTTPARNRKRREGATQPPWLVRFSRGHWRLWLAIALGVATYVALTAAPQSSSLSLVTRLLLAWNGFALAYLTAAAIMMARSTHNDIARYSDEQDEGAFGILIFTLTAAAASLGAIFAELVEAKDAAYGAWPYVLAIGTVVVSWTLIHVMFALHYAFDFYGDGDRACGLDFPGDEKPDYWDFVYFSFVIGMTFQVSDVGITKKLIRRSAVLHGALSFFFNTAVIALTVNMAANAF